MNTEITVEDSAETRHVTTFRLSTQDGGIQFLVDKDIPWIRRFCDVIQPLLNLKDGWDDDEARHISPAAVSKTMKVLGQVLADKSPFPHISAHPWGGIVLEWQSPRKLLQVQIASNGVISVYWRDDDKSLEQEEENVVELQFVKERLKLIA
ncbi:MAG: hypothetical protein K2X77_11725 [Candidatus Obscuribacterales bacterium]|nr:hypothetical protein [Candidatus Obscuribacterales bacterium]